MELPAEEMKAIVLRMKRARGHLSRVIAMIEEGSECEDVLTQLAAVTKALSRSAYAVVASGMRQCARDDDDTETAARMEKLFLALA